MPTGQPERTGAVRGRVALLDLGHVEHPVGGEVATADQVEDVPPGGVGPGDPAGARDHPRVGEVADAGGVVGAQHAGTDVALGQRGVVGEVLFDERLGLVGFELGGQPLQVDLAVAGHGDGQRLAAAVDLAHHHQHVLQGVRGGPGAVLARRRGVGVVDQGLDGGGVRGVVDVRGGRVVVRQRIRGLNVRRPRRWPRSRRRRRRRCPHRSRPRPGTPRWPSRPWRRRSRAR